MNVALILAGGYSTRFNNPIPKQLYLLNNIPLIQHSILALKSVVDNIVIVTNSQIYDVIHSLNLNIDIIINDINCRLESIQTGIQYIKTHYKPLNIIIHDSARPYVPESYFKSLFTKSLYAQYYLPLTNGLMNTKTQDILNRDDYIEICTPLRCNFNLFYFIFMHYITSSKRTSHEIIPILNKFSIPYDLIKGEHNYLRKITFPSDLSF